MAVRSRQGLMLLELIQKLGLKNIKMAEVGVWKGHTVRVMLRNGGANIKEYWGIDKWSYLGKDYPGHDYDGDKMTRLSEEQWIKDVYLQSVCKLWFWFPQLRLIRASSVEAARLFPEGYFDLVFIDADHSYEMVKKDIETWVPLVRKGGIISGHDHIRKCPGVYKAVNEYFKGDYTIGPKTVWYKQL